MNDFNSNGQKPTSGARAMQEVRSVRQMISNVHVIVGGVLFAIGAFVFILHLFFDNRDAILALTITGGALALSGAIELIVAVFFRRAALREKNKLARLKADGKSFPCEIIQLQRQIGVNFINSYSVYAECSYKNNEGKTCLVRSATFLHENGKNYSATVYVSHYDPFDYAVEILKRAASVRADYDYR